MKRKEYLERLEQLLFVLPNEEREEALQYYLDYFEDAGIENEDRVILELGSPEEVAAKIRAGYAGEYAQYSEWGYEDTRFQKNQEIMSSHDEINEEWKDSVYEAEKEEKFDSEKKTNSKNTNVWKVIAIVVLILFAAPIMFPIGIALVAVVCALIVAVVAVVFGVGVAGFAILLSGIMVIIAGIAKIFLVPAAGILAAGIGCILFAVGILLSWGMISILVKVVPGMIRGIVNILGTPFRKAGVK